MSYFSRKNIGGIRFPTWDYFIIFNQIFLWNLAYNLGCTFVPKTKLRHERVGNGFVIYPSKVERGGTQSS